MTFRELLELRAEKDGKRPFLLFRNKFVDFATLDQKVNKVANLFRYLGVKKGTHICLFLPNFPEFLYLWFGLAKIGAVMVPLNTSIRESRLAYIINHCDAEWIVVSEALYDAYASIEKDLKNIKGKIWHSECTPAPKTFRSLDKMMDSADGLPPPEVDIKDEDPLAILYTFRALGLPKGSMISHFNYINTGRVWVEDIINYREDDIVLSTMPLYHANAQMLTAMSCLVSGRPYVLGERFSPSVFFDEVRQYGATILHLSGSMVARLIGQPERENDSDNPARIASTVGTPLEIWENFEKRFNLKILEGYGVTECGVACLSNTENDRRIGSVGKPTRICNATIWDGNGQKIPTGQTGEIVVKELIPHSMFLGYYKQPDKTEEVREGGWFHTGDRGYKDVDGYFFFIDRVNESIRSRGVSISPFEIEAIVNSNPKVLESAAVGVISDLGEEEVKIYVVVKPGERLEIEELVKFCYERMAHFMSPRYVEFVKELPKVSKQKIQRLELKMRGVGNAWDREKEKYRLISKEGHTS